MDYLDKVFLWLGKTNNSQEKFEAYFSLDYSCEGDFENPNYKICGFCEDIGEKWYDEDFIGYLRYDTPMNVTEILEEAPIDAHDKEQIIKISKNIGLEEVNAIYWYSGEIHPPSQDKSYNGLQYIGEFNLD